MKKLKFLGVGLLIISAIILFILFINGGLPKWLTGWIFGILLYLFLRWVIKDAVKDAINESLNNDEIIEKLDEISQKLSYTFSEDSPEETEVGIGLLFHSSYENLKHYLVSINENLTAIREIIKNR